MSIDAELQSTNAQVNILKAITPAINFEELPPFSIRKKRVHEKPIFVNVHDFRRHPQHVTTLGILKATV